MKKHFQQKRFFAAVALAFLVASAVRAQSLAPEQLHIRALFAEPDKPSVYEIAFTAREPLRTDAELALEFPAEFDLSQLQIAGSPDITGGFTLTRDKQKVWVKRSGLGQSVAAGTLVRVRLGAIVNPQKLESDVAVAVQVRPGAQTAWSAATKQSVAFMLTEKSE